MNKTILLTFDVEEFDLPNEYNNSIGNDEQISVTTSGLLKIILLLKKHDIKATFFVTANYAEQNSRLIKEISKDHEIASHAFFHSNIENNHIELSKVRLEEITGKRIHGFRMPRLERFDLGILKKAGYSYDSSINPTIIPGRYNNFFKSRTMLVDGKSKLTVLPFSVSPIIRFPLFWLSFKNISYNLYLLLCKLTLNKDHYLHLYFHPWEFSNIGQYKIPDFTKKIFGNELIERLDKLICDLKNEANFSTIIDFINSQKPK